MSKRPGIFSIFLIIWWGLTSQSFLLAQERTLQRQLKNDPTQAYQLYLPENYQSGQKYPLFVAIHWYKGNANRMIEHWHKLTSHDQYILLAPDFNDGYQWLNGKEDLKLIEILDEAALEFPYDKKQVYVVGCSGGGQFAHRFAFKHPEHVSAVAMMGTGHFDSPPGGSSKRVKFLVGVGEEDIERVDLTKKFYQELLLMKYDVRFKIFPGVGHSCGTEIQKRTMEFLQTLNNPNGENDDTQSP